MSISDIEEDKTPLHQPQVLLQQNQQPPYRANRRYIVIILLIIIGFGIREFVRWRNTQYMTDHLKQFTSIQALDYYEESQPRFSVGKTNHLSTPFYCCTGTLELLKNLTILLPN